MKKKVSQQDSHGAWIRDRWAALIPIGMCLAFTVSYVVSQKLFISCPTRTQSLVACTNVDITLIIPTVPPLAIDPNVPPEDPANVLIHRELIAATENGTKIISERYRGRFIWMFFTAANLLIIAFALVAFSTIVARWLRWKAAVTILLVSIVVGLVMAFGDNPPIGEPLTNLIAKGIGGIHNLRQVNDWVNGFGYAVAIAMVAAMSAILFHTPRDHGGGRPIKIFSEKKDHLSFLLYLSTILLIVGLLRSNAGFVWAQSFMDVGAAEVAKPLLANVTAVLGGFFTLLLASIYLPTGYILQQRARSAIIAEDPEIEDAGKELDRLGLNFSLSEAIPRILAVAGPVLTGSIADLLTKL